MITFDGALARLIAVAQPLGTETVPFAAAAGRVLARGVTARFSMPRSDVSSMDGYAIRAADWGTIPFSLPIAGEQAAGSPPGRVLPAGTAFRIFTGASLPAGAERVIVQENAVHEGDRVTFVNPHGPDRFIRPAGSDFMAGDELVPAGTRLGWRALTSAAAADQGELVVWSRPRVVILATGDELAAPGKAHLRPGAIPDSISPGVAAFVAMWGGVVIGSERLPDAREVMAASAAHALQDADLVVMIGGASVGDRDHSRNIFGAVPDYVFPKVAIKPGKPVWLARVSGRLVLGLPGNPTSALVTARLFLAPLLVGLGGGDASTAVAFERGKCLGPLPACGDREVFQRARRTEKGLLPVESGDSGNQRWLATADALIRRPKDADAEPAESMVTFLAF